MERAIAEHELAQRIIARVSGTPVITIDRYGEVFNRAGQNFRLQKRAPALILAKKHGKTVLPAPEGYGFEQGRGFYFSHMLNCLYDCRYCFLQGMCYDCAPGRLQAAIKRVFELATRRISIEGTEVVAFPLFEVSE